MVEISLSLCLAQLYFFAVCWHGQPAFDCHGYRLLCCHRPSSALYTPNDSLQMWTAGGWVMGRGPLWLFDPKLDANLSFYTNLEMPHFLCDFKPLLRVSCSDAHLSEDLMMVLTGLKNQPSLLHHKLLCPYFPCCSSGPISTGETESPGHMHLPPLHGHPLLHLGLCHLPEVPMPLGSGRNEAGLCIWRNFVSREEVFQQIWHPFQDVEIVKEGQKYEHVKSEQ